MAAGRKPWQCPTLRSVHHQTLLSRCNSLSFVLIHRTVTYCLSISCFLHVHQLMAIVSRVHLAVHALQLLHRDYIVDCASIDGGKIPIDPISLHPSTNNYFRVKQFLADGKYWTPSSQELCYNMKQPVLLMSVKTTRLSILYVLCRPCSIGIHLHAAH